MINKYIYYIKFLLSLKLWLIIFAAHSQSQTIDILSKKINSYGNKDLIPTLFIHYDKTVYANNEDIWFTAYLLNAKNYEFFNTLSISLIKNDDRSTILERKFLIKSGLSSGNVNIPNNVMAGNYTLIATTNRLKNGMPDVFFTQSITIKTTDAEEFSATLKPIDTSATAAVQKVQLKVNFLEKNSSSSKTDTLQEVDISYHVGNELNPVIRGFGKTKSNLYNFSIPSHFLEQGKNLLHVKLWYKMKVIELSLLLPTMKYNNSVKFYPEGGNMVVNMPGIIGLEIKDSGNNPLNTEATIYHNDRIIDTVRTNSAGMGKFLLKPIATGSYYVKLKGSDKVYNLPAPLRVGATIELPEAVVNDTMMVHVKNSQQEKLFLLVHNYNQLFFSVPLKTQTTIQTLKIKLDDVPKGLLQLTLADSVGKPYAERLFFAHYNDRKLLNITTDKKDYLKGKQVKVKVKLNADSSDVAFVSVACIQENRMEFKNRNDIESYFYLKHDIGDVPIRESYLGNNDTDTEFLETLLLIKGWRRYTWTDVLKVTPADTTNLFSNVVLKGRVTEFNKPLNKSARLIDVNNPLNIVATDNVGNFKLSQENLLTKMDKKLSFMVATEKAKKDDSKNYQIKLADPYTILNQLLAQELKPKEDLFLGSENTDRLQIAANEQAIRLNEVIVKGKKDDTFYGKIGFNEDGSYIFKTATVSQRNNIDFISNSILIRAFRTTAPRDYLLLLDGINHQPKEFYVSDISQNPAEAEYLSTLYWKNLLQLLPNKEVEFSFYTGAISGKFKIIIQGITSNSVTYGETDFNVLKSK